MQIPTPAEPIQKKIKLPRLSASKLTMYQQCPTMYQYRYIEGDRGINVWGIIGSAAHKAIEKVYSEQAPILQTFLIQANKTIKPGMEGMQHILPLMRDIQDGLAAFDETQYTPVALERHFFLPYPNAENPICTLEGYIDFVGTNNADELFPEADYMVDWKTGKDDPTEIESNVQFIVYAWAFEQIYGKKPERIIMHRVRDNNQIIGRTFDFAPVHELIVQVLQDPLTYELTPCDHCPVYCGVRKHVVTTIQA